MNYECDLNQYFADMCQDSEPVKMRCDDDCPHFFPCPWDTDHGICVEDRNNIEWVERMEPWEGWCCEC